MKYFSKSCAQGDVYIRRVDSLPANVVEVTPEDNGCYIVTHSETSHHHVMDAKKVKMYNLPDSILDCFLVVNDPTALEHLRNYDTHEPIMFDRGTYHVRRQREYVAGAWKAVQD